MNLLLEGNEIPNVYVSEENINILGCNALEEVFFDVFEIKTNSFEFVKEKKGDWNGNPVFELDVLLDNVLYKDCKFAVLKDSQTSINPSLLDPSKISIKTEKVEKIPYTNKTPVIKDNALRIQLEGIEIPNVYVSSEKVHILGCNSLEEVFFDLYEIKTNSFELMREKKGEWNGNPVFELDVIINDAIYNNCKFAIIKDGTTSINPSLLNIPDGLIKIENIKKISYTNKTRLIKEESFVPKNPEPPRDIKKELESFIKEESSNGFIKEIIKDQFHSLLEGNPNDSKVTKFFNMYTEGFKKSFIEISEKIARREGLRAMESGGGTNSMQFADGGIMRGNLTIVGNLSAVNLQGNITSSGVVQKATFTIGDNINSNYILSHNFDNLNVIVQVYDNSTNEVVYPFIKNDDTNNTRVSFPNVIGLNSYRVIVLS
jgi:hypothetical protein